MIFTKKWRSLYKATHQPNLSKRQHLKPASNARTALHTFNWTVVEGTVSFQSVRVPREKINRLTSSSSKTIIRAQWPQETSLVALFPPWRSQQAIYLIKWATSRKISRISNQSFWRKRKWPILTLKHDIFILFLLYIVFHSNFWWLSIMIKINYLIQLKKSGLAWYWVWCNFRKSMVALLNKAHQEC